jgi:hypothetical protein
MRFIRCFQLTKRRPMKRTVRRLRVKFWTPSRGYFYGKKEAGDKRPDHELRCKKYARFGDKLANTFWGLPLDKPWFICSFYKGERDGQKKGGVSS